MSEEQSSREIGEFFRGLLDNKPEMSRMKQGKIFDSGNYGWTNSLPTNDYQDDLSYQRYTTASGVHLERNQAARLISGHLLIGHNFGRCYRVDPNNGEIEFFFALERKPDTYFWSAVPDKDGSIYCSISGITTGEEPLRFADFKSGGAVLKVNHKLGELSIIAEGEHVIDPFGLELLPNHRLLVSDFNGWGGEGAIYVIDVRTGARQVLAKGGEFVDPEMATMDEDGTIWVANAMHQQYDGNIIRVDPGNKQTVIYPTHGPGSGIVAGIFPSNTPDKVLFVIVDWPFMATSSVISLEKKTGNVEVLLTGSVNNPRLYSTRGAVLEDILYIAESYNNLLVAYDLKSKKIAREFDISPISGVRKGFGVKGVMNSFDMVECINVIP